MIISHFLKFNLWQLFTNIPSYVTIGMPFMYAPGGGKLEKSTSQVNNSSIVNNFSILS